VLLMPPHSSLSPLHEACEEHLWQAQRVGPRHAGCVRGCHLFRVMHRSCSNVVGLTLQANALYCWMLQANNSRQLTLVSEVQ
jgi:hypothetical protein